MENSGGMQASLAGRYASALFDLARDEKQIDAVSRSLDSLNQALADSRDLDQLVISPLVSREDAGKAFAAVAGQLELDPITTNFIGVLARNGRKARASRRHPRVPPARRQPPRRNHRRSGQRAPAQRRPDRQAEGAAAQPAPAATSRSKPGSTRHILGGLVVKLGSQMIDASLRTKLNRLAQAMKG